VSGAQSGHAALTILRREPVHLLITDYLMPGMTGHELIETARAEGFTCPVLVITGYAHLLEQSGWWQRYPHLSKPLHFDALRAQVTALLAKSSTPPC
jgi:CheY-like chemotaxis protein